MIDGKRLQRLKRHLAKNGLDIDSYRACNGLPFDYPSISANYSATRVALARSMGLGCEVSRSRHADNVESDAAPAAEAAAKRRGRRTKAA